MSDKIKTPYGDFLWDGRPPLQTPLGWVFASLFSSYMDFRDFLTFVQHGDLPKDVYYRLATIEQRAQFLQEKHAGLHPMELQNVIRGDERPTFRLEVDDAG